MLSLMSSHPKSDGTYLLGIINSLHTKLGDMEIFYKSPSQLKSVILRPALLFTTVSPCKKCLEPWSAHGYRVGDSIYLSSEDLYRLKNLATRGL
ncbi:hypothetical protein Tco_0015873 [Tanacetum coccineum]